MHFGEFLPLPAKSGGGVFFVILQPAWDHTGHTAPDPVDMAAVLALQTPTNYFTVRVLFLYLQFEFSVTKSTNQIIKKTQLHLTNLSQKTWTKPLTLRLFSYYQN